MIVNLSALAFAATILSSNSPVFALSSDTPISSLLASANAHLAKGETNDALTYYDIAISRDPQNYLTYFRRGATYLSLGRTSQATRDFDKVLSIKPGFEGALVQRAKIHAKNGDWDAAKKDFVAHGNSAEDLAQIEEAKGAAHLAAAAEKSGNWEECVTQSGVAIVVASKMLSLRKTRAHCRFERGEVQEGMSDLKHVLQMQSGMTEPHMQISAITYYALADLERGMDQMRKCLHSDPDSKKCKKLYRREKTLDKQLAQISKFMDKKQYASAVKLLLPTKEDLGLVQDVKDDVKELRKAGTIPERAPNDLVSALVEMVCEAFHEMKNSKKAQTWCDEALTWNENSLHGLLNKARIHMEAENYDAAIASLNAAKEHHPGAQQINQLLQNAHTELKRSKTKDYYKVLGLTRDADELQIKSAYRKMVKIHHPDKAHKQGITKEDAEKKMAAVNEAYEVLSDPELKQRYDQGDDPNDHEQQRQHPFQGSPFQGGNPFGHHGGGQQFSFKFGGGGPGGFPFGG
ncbi:related to interferon-induced double-stranded RNA-activated protein kinase inhibitor [Phialocephala subalpina]|uniref:Tetratricopeptide repeat and J domain-containing co-chaperone DNJ1 n=1 Tax=Phialocephala subalpina TaxID=576137 RepID=A0A1L7WXC0_9HELO|nr:related to interferon-induced double-stranded RNA-activated protein kinase inhibitor [Phialocephala subalpina]